MIRNTLSLMVGTVLLAISGACQPAAKTAAPAPSPGRDTVTITQDRNGGQVQLQQGQTLLVRLAESTPRGLTWEMESMPDQNILMPDGQRRVRSGEQIKYDSLLSLQELRFQAVGPGMTKLDLAYDRPGGGEDEVQTRFTVDVIVEPTS